MHCFVKADGDAGFHILTFAAVVRPAAPSGAFLSLEILTEQIVKNILIPAEAAEITGTETASSGAVMERAVAKAAESIGAEAAGTSIVVETSSVLKLLLILSGCLLVKSLLESSKTVSII